MKIESIIPIIFLLFWGKVFADGYLTVKTEPEGMEVFLDGKSLGRSPIELKKLPPGSYTVSLFPNDSLEENYWRAREKGIWELIRKVPKFAQFHSAAVRVKIVEDQETEVLLSYPETLKAKKNATWLLWGGTSCLFTAGTIFGILLTLLFR
ncbi:MAG: PEGA domain-containing protein [candidate division WOR-3 bacterium]